MTKTVLAPGIKGEKSCEGNAGNYALLRFDQKPSIKEVWTDMRPLSLRKKMEEAESKR